MAGTLVDIPGGTLPIENIRVGMQVESRDDTRFANKPQKVLDTFGRVAPGYYLITKEPGVIKATEEHRFWMQGQGWLPGTSNPGTP
ncbi:MAG: hypothetical protein CSA45_06045 [Gammaproteobacteria bacterium]|nr:MAG: hypothetical protein CSA45_06045 [Gammaproteobacteria bacterium]